MRGRIKAYSAESKHFGKFLINVKLAEEKSSPGTEDFEELCDEETRATIQIATTSETGNTLYDQLKRKTAVFTQVSGKKQYYRRIALSYIDKGRLRRWYITQKDEIPDEISRDFKIVRYKDVSPGAKRFQMHLTVVLPMDDAEQLVRFFILEKVMPIKGDLHNP